MVAVNDIVVWRGRRLRVLFSNGVIGGGDVMAFVDADHPLARMLQDGGELAIPDLRNGVPTWSDGHMLAPEELFRNIEDAAQRMAVLEESNEALEFAKSGAPAPYRAIEMWLADECSGRWSYRAANVFDLHFRFELESDAERFKQRWSAVAP